ncbi:MATE family efflux transporter [Rhizobium sp. SSA_523]|uniref:MATE family efflux transporter n=1 Tax=Rhizobium sp. SSA_523 TaxID=2952477 RepID=UPI002090C2CD|nr:MATE family efflux transporter [Rhizobium sp. SSA_523]MCO5732929.1 MATE family efflux transporter [Rhizobium sp. SSA_523]WKC25813.1 MATE family efflux transporter [Rhizobium sp. SSA_523]
MTMGYLTTPLLGLTDTAVVGQLGDPAALAGLAIGAILFDLLYGSLSFLRTATTGLVAQAFGRNDPREQQAVFQRALLGSVGLGAAMLLLAPLIWLYAPGLMAQDPAVIAATRSYFAVRVLTSPATFVNFAVLGYVLGRGQGVLGLKLQILLNGTNIVLTLVFGLYLGLGITGVALGTACAELLAMIVGLILVFGQFEAADRPSRAEVFDRAKLSALFRLNGDILVRTLVLNAAFALMTRIGSAQGAVVLAANAVLMNIFLLSSFFLDGLAGASEQLAGRSVGARDRSAFRRALRLTGGWSIGMGLVLMCVFLIIGAPLISLLSTSGDVRQTAQIYLPLAALTGATGALAFHMDGIFIGATWSRDMRNMMLASLIVYAACLAIAVPALSNTGLWIALNLFLLARGLLLALLLPRKLRETFP